MKKRLFIGLLLSILSVTFMFGGVSHASVNDFTIKDFQADYYLSKDDNNRSVLKTVEQITAIFPDYDQNHGIERAIPKTYDGHNVNLSIQSVVAENGNRINYSLIDSNENTVIRIGDADTYVHGALRYVITYTQNDVTKFFSNTADEFYWDINGNSWSQYFWKSYSQSAY